MTKSIASDVDASPAGVRVPRPFLYLEPARLPLRKDGHSESIDAKGQQNLEVAAGSSVPLLVRSLIDYTIALQNRRALERGNPQPIQLSVLNRRRRAARSWILAILSGKVDGATRHAVATQWVPTLTGTGPDRESAVRPGRVLIEFLRGAITACIFDEIAESLLPQTRALHVLETTLSVHLAALHQVARSVAKVV
ncbi:MAG: hypothetical protein ABIP94_19045 [Planctomycetota bacterium]